MAALIWWRLKRKTVEFAKRYQDGSLLMNFSTRLCSCSWSWNVLGLFPYKVQVRGNQPSPWWRTRDAYRGRKPTATMPVYLNALSGKGARCHQPNIWQSGMQQRWRTILMAWPFSRINLAAKSPAEKKKSPLCGYHSTQPTQRSGLITCVTTWLVCRKHGSTSIELCLGRWGRLHLDWRSAYAVDRFWSNSLWLRASFYHMADACVKTLTRMITLSTSHLKPSVYQKSIKQKSYFLILKTCTILKRSLTHFYLTMPFVPTIMILISTVSEDQETWSSTNLLNGPWKDVATLMDFTTISAKEGVPRRNQTPASTIPKPFRTRSENW